MGDVISSFLLWNTRKKRRIRMHVGVTYSSSPEQLKKLVDGIRELIKNNEAMDQGYHLVNFDRFGPSSLDVFIYCFTKTTVWAEFLQTKEAFMLDIMALVKELGLEFAFPSQSIYVESINSNAMEGMRPK